MIEGVALHSGVHSRVRIHREEGALRFRRGRQEITASLASVVATPRCTVLGAAAARVALVEHLLAALHIANWWHGLVIEVDAEELPILDGSAQAWLEFLPSLGDPPPPPAPLSLLNALHYQDDHDPACRLQLLPGEAALCVAVDYPHPAIGAQRWCGQPRDYTELAAARTFGFRAELEAMRAHNLAKGASLDNVLAFDAEAACSPLRYPDEVARHKALDVLGDFFLLNRPLQARLEVQRGSHRAHIACLRQLSEQERLL